MLICLLIESVLMYGDFLAFQKPKILYAYLRILRFFYGYTKLQILTAKVLDLAEWNERIYAADSKVWMKALLSFFFFWCCILMFSTSSQQCFTRKNLVCFNCNSFGKMLQGCHGKSEHDNICLLQEWACKQYLAKHQLWASQQWGNFYYYRMQNIRYLSSFLSFLGRTEYS